MSPEPRGCEQRRAQGRDSQAFQRLLSPKPVGQNKALLKCSRLPRTFPESSRTFRSLCGLWLGASGSLTSRLCGLGATGLQ